MLLFGHFHKWEFPSLILIIVIENAELPTAWNQGLVGGSSGLWLTAKDVKWEFSIFNCSLALVSLKIESKCDFVGQAGYPVRSATLKFFQPRGETGRGKSASCLTLKSLTCFCCLMGLKVESWRTWIFKSKRFVFFKVFFAWKMEILWIFCRLEHKRLCGCRVL